MKSPCTLALLIVGSSAWAQAPCTLAPTKSATAFFIEPEAAAQKDTLVLVRLCTVSGPTIGSYMAMITFDSTRMRVARVVARGGMQATNAEVPGVVRIAGAAPSGFANGELAQISFKPVRRSLDHISLVVSEANSTTGASLLPETSVAGWPRKQSMIAAARPVIDSISPRAGELDNDRVTDITIYGRGFATAGNVVFFGGAQLPGLKSESNGTVIRFSAPSIRVRYNRALVRVKHHEMESNTVTFRVRGDTL